MLVIKKLDTNLRSYLESNHNQLTWKERIKIVYNIIVALHRIQNEEEIHKDLHSGNVLYYQRTNSWFISDFGFCGPVDKPLGSIYGNLPYIAPEVIAGRGYSFASDIYSIGMLMWEISSGEPPFIILLKNVIIIILQ
jgi:serine/threonine protein kinase